MARKTNRLKLKSKKGTRRSKIHRKKSNTKRRHVRVRRFSRRGGMRAAKAAKAARIIKTQEQIENEKQQHRQELSSSPSLPPVNLKPNSMTSSREERIRLFKDPKLINTSRSNIPILNSNTNGLIQEINEELELEKNKLKKKSKEYGHKERHHHSSLLEDLEKSEDSEDSEYKAISSESNNYFNDSGYTQPDRRLPRKKPISPVPNQNNVRLTPLKPR